MAKPVGPVADRLPIRPVATASATPRASRAPWQARFALLAAIWGCSFLFIKVGDEALAPLHVALGRMILGSLTLMLVLVARGERLPRTPGVWKHLAVAGLVSNALPFSLYAYGETRVTSVLAGIWNATTPLVTLLVVLLALTEERPSRERIAGLLLGFAGAGVVLGVWRGVGSQALLGNLACFGAAACYGVGFPYARKHLAGRPESSIALSAAQLLCGTAELTIVTPFFTTFPATLPLQAVGSILALGALGTGVAYVLNYGLLREVGATATSTVTYVIPLFATAVGVLVLGEPLTWNEPVGAVVVLLGILVSQGRLTALRILLHARH